MFSSYLIDIRDHRSFHHCFDPSTFYSKPRNYQCLYHLQRIKDKKQQVGFTATDRTRRRGNKTPLTSGPSSASPAMQPYRVVHCVLSSSQLWKKKKKSGFMCFAVFSYLVFDCLF